jgi:hypothetical protein
MIEYNPTVLRRHADRLYGLSYVLVVIFGMLGLAVGCVAAFVLFNFTKPELRPAPNSFWPILGGSTVLGVLVGIARGFALRLKAQQILCQVAIEENTRSPLKPPE